MTLLVTRRLGALALLAVGAVHLQQYLGADYRAVPTIGWLFLLNAIGSGLVGLALLAPLERVKGHGDAVAALLSSAGVAIAIAALISLFISESSSLFGFSESGYRAAIVAAIVAEGLTTLLLTPTALGHIWRARHREHRAGPASGWRPSRHQPYGA